MSDAASELETLRAELAATKAELARSIRDALDGRLPEAAPVDA